MKKLNVKSLGDPSRSTALQPPNALPQSHQSFSTNDRVRSSNGMVGVCRFIGTIENKNGLWVGIDLGAAVEDPGQESFRGKGKNSGSVNGVSYFECDQDCGIFFPINKVSLYPSNATTHLPSPTSFTPPQKETDSPSAPAPPPRPSSSHQTNHGLISPRWDVPNNRSSLAFGRSCASVSTPKSRPRPSLPTQSFLGGKSPVHANPTPPIPTQLLSSSQSRRVCTSIAKKPSERFCGLRIVPSSTPQTPPVLQSISSNRTEVLGSRHSQLKRGHLTSELDTSAKPVNGHSKQSSISPIPDSDNLPAKSHIRSESVQSHYHRAEWSGNSSNPPKRPNSKLNRRPQSVLSQRSHSRLSQRSHSRLSQLSQDSPTVLTSAPQKLQQPPGAAAGCSLEEVKSKNKYRIDELNQVNQSLQQQLRDLTQSSRTQRVNLELELDDLRQNIQSLEHSKQKEISDLKQTKEGELSQLEAQLCERFRSDLEQSQRDLAALRTDYDNLSHSTHCKEVQLLETLEKSEAEKGELVEQLDQLRSAGQSLCSVYEGKIRDLEELRLEQLGASNRLIQELRQSNRSLEEQRRTPESGCNPPDVDRTQHLHAVEIDNESLKADLQHTREKLSEVQEQVYQLREQLENETQGRQHLIESHNQAVSQLQLSLKETQEGCLIHSKEKEDLSLRLKEVEQRCKECLETMEQERTELEALRDQLMASQHQAPSSKQSQLNLHTAPKVGDVRPDPLDSVSRVIDGSDDNAGTTLIASNPPDPSLTATQGQELESKVIGVRLELEAPDSPPSHCSSSPTSSSPLRLHPPAHLSTAIEHEKALVIQKYQRILLLKDQENLSLLSRIQEMEDGLIGFNSSTSLDLQQNRQLLKVAGSPRRHPSINRSASQSSLPSLDEPSSVHSEVSKGQQVIVGLKVLLSQSNDSRATLERDNRQLKNTIEELKKGQQGLEQTIEQIISAKRSSFSSSSESSSPSAYRSSHKNFHMVVDQLLESSTGPIDDCDQVKRGTEKVEGAEEILRISLKFLELKAKKLEEEVKTLKQAARDLDQRRSKEVNALGKEVNELESIIENKVFREEELENEIEQLKDLMKSAMPTPFTARNSEQLSSVDQEQLGYRGGSSNRQSSMGSGDMMSSKPVRIQCQSEVPTPHRLGNYGAPDAVHHGHQNSAAVVTLPVGHSESDRNMCNGDYGPSDGRVCEVGQEHDHSIEACPVFTLQA